tara:strand:- start:2471 stop:4375 length:1905 start_codon:yes stop_codon:yes gene_type:complete
MAYNKSKGKQKHGDVIYDKDTDTQIDFEQNEIKFRTGGSVRGSFTDGGLSVTGSHIIVGEISSSLGYSGSTGYFNREVIAGVISGSQVEALGGFFDIIASPNNGEANARTLITNGGILSSSQTTALNALDIGEGTFTVSKEGVVASSGSVSVAGVISGSSTATFAGMLQSSNENFTVSSDGVINAKRLIATSHIVGGGSVTGAFGFSGSAGRFDEHVVSGHLSGTLIHGGTVNVGEGVFTVASDGDATAKRLNATSHIIGAATITGAFGFSGSAARFDEHVVSGHLSGTLIHGGTVDVGEGTFTVSKEGVVASSGSISGTVLSGSSTATLHSLNVGQGMFTVSNEGATELASLDIVNGGITNAGSIAGATSVDGSGDLTMGTITMTGFTVDADGDTAVKTLSASANIFGSGLHLTKDAPTVFFTNSAGTGLASIGVNASQNILIQNDTTNKHIVFKANDGGTIREGLRLDGAIPEVVVNQTSDSLMDFRVESDNNTHMLYVSGGADKVGINTSAPTQTFSVIGSTIVSGSTHSSYTVRDTAGGYAISALDNVIVFNNASGQTATLPQITTTNHGIQYYIKNIGSGVVTVTGSTGHENFIDGQQSLSLSQGDSAKVMGIALVTGFEWLVLSYYNV